MSDTDPRSVYEAIPLADPVLRTENAKDYDFALDDEPIPYALDDEHYAELDDDLEMEL